MKEPQPMREVHEIQEMLYEEEKNMTPEERISKIRREARHFLQKHGLKFEIIDLDKAA